MLKIDYNVIGKRIATLRRMKHMTQSQLAEKADISNNYLSHIETSRSIPSLETLMSLCSALDVTPDEILLGTKTSEKNYLVNDITQQLENCTTEQKQLILDIISLIVKKYSK